VRGAPTKASLMTGSSQYLLASSWCVLVLVLLSAVSVGKKSVRSRTWTANRSVGLLALAYIPATTLSAACRLAVCEFTYEQRILL
jgi:hypothetical protein